MLRARRAGPARAEAGFTLADSMIAVAVVMIGIVGIVQMIPFAAKAGVQARTSTSSNLLAISKMDELLNTPYSSIASSAAGDFTTLIGPSNFSNLGNYTWSYSSSEEIPGILKQVNLGITVGDRTDSYVFYVADMADATP